MKALKIFAVALLMIFIAQGRTFAEMPEIAADETYFDIFSGVYVLNGNVDVKTNNHGFIARIKADEAQVSVVNQKCWTAGNVNLEHEDIIFGCDRAYIEWATRTAKVIGNVKFKNKNSVAINSDTAIFNWEDKVVDFYGKVTLDGEEFQHVQYNIVEDKILSRDKTFDIPLIVIPDVDGN